jgi:hypothetical protein
MLALFSAYLHRLFAADAHDAHAEHPQAMGMYASTYLHRSDWNPR